MEPSDFLCYNCQGTNHRSSLCPFPATRRRCPTCGKAGGDYTHRTGCDDSWYDLSVRVPRYDSQNQPLSTKKQVANALKEEFDREKSRNRIDIDTERHASNTELPLNVSPAVVPPENSVILNDECEKSRDQPKEMLFRAIQLEMHPEISSAAIPAEKWIASVEKKSCNQVKNMATPSGTPLLMRFVFGQKPTAFIDFGSGSERELRDTIYQMQNGLQVKYSNGMLDFYGRAYDTAVFMVNTVQGAFRLTIDGYMADVNGSHFFTEIGVVIRPRSNGQPPKYGITLIGSREKEIRVRYRADRYIMKLDNEEVQINPFEL